MESSEFSGIERRRSARTKLTVPLRIHGQDRNGEKFTVDAETHTVSDSGCLLYLEASLNLDQTLFLVNANTRQSIRGRVVSSWRQPAGKTFVGIEFLSQAQNFWSNELPNSEESDPSKSAR